MAVGKNIMQKGAPGKVITAAVSHLKDMECDVVWRITRAGPTIKGVKRVLDFAPSNALFDHYQHEWKGRDPEQWWPLYERRFVKYLADHRNGRTVELLQQLVRSGKTVALVCFCSDSRYCHRSLVARFLRDKGLPVEEFSERDAPNLYGRQLSFFRGEPQESSLRTLSPCPIVNWLRVRSDP